VSLPLLTPCAQRIAGLCHDLGHGPFSHVFDNEFIPRARWVQRWGVAAPETRRLTWLLPRPGVKWSHEDMSLSLFDLLIDENNIEMNSDEIKFVKDVIIGSKRA